MAQSDFALPEAITQVLAGEIRGFSFSSATWGARFPEVDDLANLPADAKCVSLSKDPKNLELLRGADRLVAIKTLVTTPEIVSRLPYLGELRMEKTIRPNKPGGATKRLLIYGKERQLDRRDLYKGANS